MTVEAKCSDKRITHTIAACISYLYPHGHTQLHKPRYQRFPQPIRNRQYTQYECVRVIYISIPLYAFFSSLSFPPFFQTEYRVCMPYVDRLHGRLGPVLNAADDPGTCQCHLGIVTGASKQANPEQPPNNRLCYQLTKHLNFPDKRSF